MPRPIPLHTAFAKLDNNGNAVSLTYYASDFQPGMVVNCTRPDGSHYTTAIEGLLAANKYTKVVLYDSGRKKSEEHFDGSSKYVRLAYEDKSTIYGIGEFGSTTYKIVEVPKLINSYEHVAGQYVDEKIFNSDSFLTERSVVSQYNSFSLHATYNPSNQQYNVQIQTNAGGNLVAQGGGNFTINGLVAQGGGNLVAQGGGNLVAQGGGNIDMNVVSGLVAQGGGNFSALNFSNTASLIGPSASGIIRDIATANRSWLISNDGGGFDGKDIYGVQKVLSNDGGSFTRSTLSVSGDGEIDDTLSPYTGDDFGDNAANASTLYLNANGAATINGEIQSVLAQDTDWFRVELVQGKTYLLEMKGAGTGDGTMVDPTLWLYDNTVNGSTGQTGNIITYNDEGGTNHNAKILYTATYSGFHYLGAWAPTQDHDANATTPRVNASSGTYTLSVTEQNLAPRITSLGGGDTGSASINEYGMFVANLAATSPTGYNWSIAGGEDASKFWIAYNSTTGQYSLQFLSPTDYERPSADGDTIFEVDVKVTNGDGLTDVQQIGVVINDVAEPEWTDYYNGRRSITLDRAENDPTYVTPIRAYDSVDGYSLTYSLHGVDYADFYFNDGKLYWNTTPDFENPRDSDRDNRYEVELRATNSNNKFTSMFFTIDVTNGADAGIKNVLAGQNVDDTATKAPFSTATVEAGGFSKISLSTSAYGTFTAASLQAAGFTATGNPNEWSRNGSASDLTAALRALVFDPNENAIDPDQTVEIDVTAFVRDSVNQEATKTTTLYVKGVNAAPVIGVVDGDDQVYMNENDTFVATVPVTDDGPSSALTWSISPRSGLDNDLFTIDQSGNLSFKSAPDYENPRGQFSNPNDYAVEIQVTDAGGKTDGTFVIVHVQDVYEQPTSPQGTPASETITGIVGAETMHAGEGNDILIGLSGPNELYGDGGTDTASYVGTSAAVVATLTATGGSASVGGVSNDTFYSIENLTGGSGADSLTGNDISNTLDGGGGADTLTGNGGADIYVVDNAGDQIVEAGGATIDRVVASVSYVLAAGRSIEVMGTTNAAGTGAINLTGNELVQTIYGNAGANRLDGKGGADTLQGFGGNDLYVVDNLGDKVVEAAGGGTDDRVVAGLSYVLATGQDIELLGTTNAAGTGALNLTGNEKAQTLQGNAGANSLDGKGGADTLYGFAGNDTYYVDNAGDAVFEGASQGTNDRVAASLGYTLAAGQQVETMLTTNSAGTGAINLTGNEFVQAIVGNAGANRLDGKAGADTMTGLAGNDIYTIDNVGDRVVEAAGGGTDDRAVASVSYTLAAGQSVDVLGTTSSAGTGAINLTGNELAQTVIGNAGINQLDGKGGADTLSGLGGKDIFLFTTALNANDRITDFSVADDTMHLSRTFFGVLPTGALSQDAFKDLGVSGASVDGDDRIIYDRRTGVLSYDADGVDTTSAAVQFAVLTNKAFIGYQDFLVV